MKNDSFYDVVENGLAGNKNTNTFGTPKNKKGFIIQFYHVPTIKNSLDQRKENGSQATFPAFITTFRDAFKVSWNSKETLNRMDAIQTFKNTQRTLSIVFDVPASCSGSAKSNFYELQKLIMMQYPVFESIPGMKGIITEGDRANMRDPFAMPDQPGNTDTTVLQPASAYSKRVGSYMSSPPLLYVKFKNWISNNGRSSSDSEFGFENLLVGTLDSVIFQPDMEMGVFYEQDKMYPKLFTVDLNMTIIHTEELGWSKMKNGNIHVFGDSEQPKGESFPYQTEEINYNKKK